MRCEQAREALVEARYDSQRSPELEAHLSECNACAALHAREFALDHFLALDEPAAVRPGFDTRFFARLAEEKSRMRRQGWLRWAWALVPVVAGAALVLWRPAPPVARAPASASAELPEDDVGLAVELDLVEDIAVVRKLDEVEAYDVLSEIDEGELERIAGESR